MTTKTQYAGWILACLLFAALFIQRSCSKSCPSCKSLTRDTVIVKGDKELVQVQDTVLKPEKMYYPSLANSLPIDTAMVLKDYFAGRTYTDTIHARDVVAVIHDSIADNKLSSRKVLIENTRSTHLDLPLAARNKFFIGGFFGFAALNFRPSAGVSLDLITKKDALYSYRYDIVNQSHTIGMSWKIHFGKK